MQCLFGFESCKESEAGGSRGAVVVGWDGAAMTKKLMFWNVYDSFSI